ncbi:hypothetical protein DXF93_00740 [Escherichia coli]|nr:hypothetical protein DXF93_00740 [Escherichia coli]
MTNVAPRNIPALPLSDLFHHFIPQIPTKGVYGAEEKLVKPVQRLTRIKDPLFAVAFHFGEIPLN